MSATLGASLVQSRLNYANSHYVWNVSIERAQTTVCQEFSYSCGSAFLLFAIFQQVSDLVTSTGFLFITKYSSNSLHLLRLQQPVSHLISTISCKYTSHHELSILKPSNFSMYHTCLLIWSACLQLQLSYLH